MVKINFSSKTNLIVRCLALLASIVILVFVGKALSKEAKLIAASKLKLAESNRDLVLLDNILVDRQKYAADIEKIKKSLPGDYWEVAFFTEQLEKLAAANNLVLETAIDTTVKEDTGGLSSLKFTIKTKGSYQSNAKMLSDISGLPYHTRVDSIKMQKEEGRIAGITTFRLFVNK